MSEERDRDHANRTAKLKENYYDENGSPVYYVDAHGVPYWGQMGTAENLGLDPEICTLTPDQMAAAQQQSIARALWENADVPAFDGLPYEQKQSRER